MDLYSEHIQVHATGPEGADSTEQIALQRWEVIGHVQWPIATIHIRQIFRNTSPDVLEVVYSFPLSSDMVLEKFRVVLGDQELEARVVSREEARKTYETVVEKGDLAVKVETHRSNAFSLNIGNLAPDEHLLVEYQLMQFLETRAGRCVLRVPTVIGPRYIPGTPTEFSEAFGWALPTDVVPDADKITPPVKPDGVPYRVSAVFRIEETLPVRRIESPSHPFAIEKLEDGRYQALMGDDLKADRDIVLEITWEAQQGAQWVPLRYRGTDIATLMVWGQNRPNERDHRYDVTFLVDISGSMTGEKLETTKKAVQLCLRKLLPNDRFRIIAFESRHYVWPEKDLWAWVDEASIALADRWIKKLESLGGTELYPALVEALKGDVPNHQESVIVLLTDGQVGDEARIVELIQKSGFRGRMLLFGIDTAVNQHLFTTIQRVVPALTEYIYPGQDISRAVNLNFQAVRYPWIQEMHLITDRGAVPLTDSFHQLPVYLEQGTYAVLFFETPYPVKSAKQVQFQFQDTTITVPLQSPSVSETLENRLLKLWARRLIPLEEAAAFGNEEWHSIPFSEIAREFELISPYTAWIATHIRKEKVDGVPTVQVIPVEAPVLWHMDRVFDKNMDMLMHPLRNTAEVCYELEGAVFAAPPTNGVSDLWLMQQPDGALWDRSIGVSRIMTTIGILWWLLEHQSDKELQPFLMNLKRALEFVLDQMDQLTPEDSILWEVFCRRFAKRLVTLLSEAKWQSLVETGKQARKPKLERRIHKIVKKKISDAGDIGDVIYKIQQAVFREVSVQ